MRKQFLILLWLIPIVSSAQTAIIPQPVRISTTNEVVEANSLAIEFEPNLKQEADYLRESWTVNQKTGGVNKQLKCSLIVDKSFKPSHYRLKITNEGILLAGGDQAAVFYGIQSLLSHYDRENHRFQHLEIEDWPTYSWRGMHLDCSRHFFSVDEVKKYIDFLAMYKMNVFHWHLTDDQGWRAEIKAFPALTSKGAWRKETLVGRPSSTMQFDKKPYGGYYTQEQMKEVVAYAAKRHITVVPEIEMPGHALAALSGYPELSCTGGPFEVGTYWGVFDDVFCAGNEQTFQVLTQIFDEIVSIFPSSYIHIGGDECPKTRWKSCSKCQLRMTQEGLKDEHELQSYFIKRIEKHLNQKGRRIIGWDEILEGGLAPNAAVMSWRGTEGGIAASKAGHYVVMSPGSPCYFDHYQFENKEVQPLAIGGYNPLNKVYAFVPTPSSLSVTEAKYILGAQGNVWTEYMKSFDHVSYMAMPRMAALAEALWTPTEKKDYASFLLRLKIHQKELDRKQIRYAKIPE